MQNTIRQYLSRIGAESDRSALDTLFSAATHAGRSCAITTAGLVIKAGASTLAKTGAAAFYGVVGGRLVTIAAGVDMPALTGITIAANNFNVVCFFISDSSVVTAVAGTAAASIAAVRFPDFPIGRALVGFLLITHSATFTGGTTALDTATTVYVSPLSGFDPTVLVS